MKIDKALLFLMGSLLGYAAFLCVKYTVNLPSASWKFHVFHGVISVVIAFIFEAYQRRRLGLKTKLNLSSRLHTRQFFINTAIWFGLVALVFPTLEIPNSNFRLLIYSFVIYLASASLVTIFNLITLEHKRYEN